MHSEGETSVHALHGSVCRLGDNFIYIARFQIKGVNLTDNLNSLKQTMYVYICVKTSFCVVRHLDSIASYLPTGLHLGFFRSCPSLYLPSSFLFRLPRALFCFGTHFNETNYTVLINTGPETNRFRDVFDLVFAAACIESCV